MGRRGSSLLWAIGAALAAFTSIPPTVARAAPTPRFVATPVQGATCVAPCVVHLDATATTSTDHARPFHELDYAWECGEPHAGVWSNRTGGDRNRPRGPVTGCVYETPGPKTIRLVVYEPDGEAASAETTVVVADPNAYFAGAATVCVSARGDFTDCPAGATRLVSGDFDDASTSAAGCHADTSHRRCLLHCGESYVQDRPVQLAPGTTPALLSCYGAGRATITSSSEFGVVDGGWTVSRIAWAGQTTGAGGFDLSHVNGRVTLHDGSITTRGGPSVTHQLAGDRHPDLVAIVGSRHTIVPTGSDRYSQHFLRARRQLLLGNVFDANGEGEFNVRSIHTPLSAIQHNELLDPQDDPGNVRNPLQLRAFAQAHGTGLPVASTQWVVVSDNWLETRMDGVATGTAIRTCQENGCNDAPGVGRDLADVLLERNWIRPTSLAANANAGVFYLQGGRITVRNNVVDLQGMDRTGTAPNKLVVHVPNQALCPGCADDEIVVQGNTVYWDESSRRGLRLCESYAGSGHVCGANLAWLPGDTGERTEIGAGSWIAAGNFFAATNPFAALPRDRGLGAPRDFALASHSPARDRLVAAMHSSALSRDFGHGCRGTLESGAIDAGAWEHAAADCTGAALPPAICGNGVLELGEACDDGNARDGDTCSARCRTGAVFGSSLRLSDKAGDPARRRLSLSVRDDAIELPPFGAGDVTQLGALLALHNPGTGETARIPLPPEGWTALGTPPGSRGYRYRDRTRVAGPCTLADVRAGRSFRVSCAGAALGFTLDEPSQGSLVASFVVGFEHPMCVAFAPPHVTRDAPATGRTLGGFSGRNAPPPATCSVP